LVRSAEAFAKEKEGRRREERLDRVRQGGLILQAASRHRERLALCRALNGSWRMAKWQSVIRSLDASAAREQRRLRADSEALKAKLDQERIAAAKFHESEAGEAERNELVLEETNAILEEVQRERQQQADLLESLRNELELTSRSEAQALHEAAEVRAQKLALEADQRATSRELGQVRAELREARQAVERHAQAEVLREREFSEHSQALQQKALVWNLQAHDSEREVREHAARVEREVEERARKAEQTLEKMLEEQTRNSELQASMAEEQERSIRHLEELVKEQGSQLRHERRERSKSADQLRASASLTESKSLLLQEQVAALRQQLQREQAELRASERAWAGDRAALLSAVVKAPTPLLNDDDDGPMLRASSQRGRRRTPKASASPLRNSSTTRSILGRGNCPWHGSGKAARLLEEGRLG